MYQIRYQAEIFYGKQGSYKGMSADYPKEIATLSADILHLINSTPYILSSGQEYCAFVELATGDYYCVDMGVAKRTSVNPNGWGYCNLGSATFVCP